MVEMLLRVVMALDVLLISFQKKKIKKKLYLKLKVEYLNQKFWETT